MGLSSRLSSFETSDPDERNASNICAWFKSAAADESVMIVEDEDSIRELFRRNLEGAGWEIVEADNGRSALDQLQQRTPSLILPDLMISEMDGVEFMEHLRSEDTWRSIPVIVTTARELTNDGRRSLNGKVINIVPNGAVTSSELVQAVQSVIKGRIHWEIWSAQRGVALISRKCHNSLNRSE